MTVAGIGPLDVPLGYAIFITLGALVFVPLAIRGRVMWHRRVPMFDEPFGWWVWGDALWRGYVRSLVAAGTVFAVDLLLLLVLIWGPESDAVVLVVASLLVLSLAVGFLLMASIVLFNRPRRLVPPYLRDQPGAVHEWLAARRATPADPPAQRPPL